MTVQTAATGNGITLAYESFGSNGDTPLLLVHGLGVQMLGWHEELCALLAGRGCHVVRFDNRDIGLSTHLHAAGMPRLRRILSEGDLTSAPYSLDDMADDTAGLLDALGWDSAHLVGVSMGGMIAQTVAARHPRRVRSLTSISSTPAPAIGAPTRAASRVLLRAALRSRDEAMTAAVENYRVIGSPAYPLDEERLREVAALSWDRGYDPAGAARQLAAIHRSGDRTAMVARIRVPTLVVHGEADPLVQPEGGLATAAAIDGAELVLVPGMGHDLPRALWPDLVERICALIDRADADAGRRAG